VTVLHVHAEVNHLVDDKMHAFNRSTSRWSRSSRVRGAQSGGQRFGDGSLPRSLRASYTLQEMRPSSPMTNGRTKMYKNIVTAITRWTRHARTSVLVKEIRSLAINVELEQD
jgi:DNA-directed RNA polymerase beta subunit